MKLPWIFALILLTAAVGGAHAASRGECESRLGVNGLNLVGVIMRAYDKGVLSADDIGRFLAQKDFQNIFSGASFSLTRDSHVRVFDALARQLSQSDKREIKIRLSQEMAKRQASQKTSDLAKQETEEVFAPAEVDFKMTTEQMNYMPQDFRQGRLDGRPIVFFRYYDKPERSYPGAVYDPFNSDKAQRLRILRNMPPMKFEGEEPRLEELDGKTYVYYSENRFLIDLRTGKNIYSPRSAVKKALDRRTSTTPSALIKIQGVPTRYEALCVGPMTSRITLINTLNGEENKFDVDGVIDGNNFKDFTVGDVPYLIWSNFKSVSILEPVSRSEVRVPLSMTYNRPKVFILEHQGALYAFVAGVESRLVRLTWRK